MNLFWLKVLRRLHLAGRVNLQGIRSVAGRPVRFPIQSEMGWEYVNDSEEWMTSLLEALGNYFRERSEMLFVDVGVNVGQTLVKVRSVVPDLPYMGFEPNPACVNYVSALISLNGWSNVDVFPVGIAETACLHSLNFFHDATADSTASIVAKFRPDQQVHHRMHIAVFPLSAVPLGRRVSFMKVDVEGAELEVLQGSTELLQKDRPLVSTEILPCYSESNTFRVNRQEEIESLMRELHYCCYRISKSATSDFIGLTPLSSIGVNDDLDLSDYLWIPAEKSVEITAMVSESLGG